MLHPQSIILISKVVAKDNTVSLSPSIVEQVGRVQRLPVAVPFANNVQACIDAAADAATTDDPDAVLVGGRINVSRGNDGARLTL